MREDDPPLSARLGALGLNGVTALLALTLVGEAEAGGTVVVSTAAGPVGATVGQAAKIVGCRVVGVAGGAEKVRLARAAPAARATVPPAHKGRAA